MTAYYNEFDPKAAAWLKQLIKNGDIAPGEVDERSITDVTASDLAGFTQHHFFAGIGVWSYALRNAGWKDDRPVCTASLPCQPFSTAGNQKGKDDERHLLPHFLELVGQCKFDCIFGEQVEAAIRHGWLDDLSATMEGEGYAVGHIVLGAHSVNSPHKRQRLYWVADSISARHEGGVSRGQDQKRKNINGYSGRSSTDSGLGNAEHDGHFASEKRSSNVQPSETWRQERENLSRKPTRASRPEESNGLSRCESGCTERDNSIEWLHCKDEKYRPIKSGVKPLVDGIARGVVYSGGAIDANNTALARSIRLKGYGNAIQSDIAKEFITAFMSVVK